MSNLEILNKLTQNVNETTQITINHDGVEYPFDCRPLTDGEISQLKKIESGTFELKVKIDAQGKRKGKVEKQDNETLVNGGEFQENKDLVKYTAIAWSLSIGDEKVPVDIVKQLAPGLPDLLFAEIIKLSGLTEINLMAVKSFLQNE